MNEPNAAHRPFYSRPLVWIIAVAVIAVLVAAGILGTKMYASSQNSAAPEEFVNEDVAQDGAAPTDDIAGEWTVGSGSEAGYRVVEVLNGENVTVVGRTEDVTGAVTIDGTTLTAGSVTVDLRTVATDESRRDNYFTSQAIDTSANPEATFTSAESVDLAQLAESGSAEVELPGTLEINGQSRDATATVNAEQTESGLAVTGSIDVTWQDFGVEAPDLGFVTVEDSGVVEFSLALARA